MTLLSRLLNLDNKTSDIDIVNNIKNYIIENITLDNIVAYYNEGKYSAFDEASNDVFFKLILVPNNLSIKDTWLINNLYTKEMNRAYNVVIRRNYDSIPLYAINENIVACADEILSINREQTGDILRQAIISSTHLRDSVLTYKIIDKNSFQIEADTYVLEDCLDDYKLAVEFEYRNHFKDAPIKASEHKKSYNIASFTDEHGYYIRGTIVLGGAELLNTVKEYIYTTKFIYDFMNRRYRVINKSNYNDDLEIAAMILNIKALDILTTNGYRLLGTVLYKDRVEITNLVDINYDKEYIVILESAVNKLDIQLIKELIKYVVTDMHESMYKVFTKYFYNMQIKGDIHVAKPSYVELAYKLIESTYQQELCNCNINIVYGNKTMKQDIENLLHITNVENLHNIAVNSLDSYNKLMGEIYNEITQ